MTDKEDNPDNSDHPQTPDKNESQDILTGPDVIKAFVKNLPMSPGVYRMLNAQGDVLYVGKAKSLKNRVQSYTRLSGQSNRIARMISQTASMEFMTTQTEAEALLLEANLIKQLKPSFNVLMRDDKSFPYILIREDHEAPQLIKHRGARKAKGSYFGPFASAGAVARTVSAMERAFLLRTCSDSEFEGRSRPCLNYQIKRCSGPCTGMISSAQYDELVRDAKAFLSGKSSKVKNLLVQRMEEASSAQEFERAAILRDRLQALAHIQSHQSINPRKMEQADVFAIHQNAGATCIQVFFFRNWQNWGNHAYYPRADKSLSEAEVLEAFLTQFYDNKPIPKLILVSHGLAQTELIEQALTSKAGFRVYLENPKRGEKRDILNHALENAKAALGRKLAETSSQTQLLARLQETFELPYRPARIEVYDNSHIQGTNAVGAMIVAGQAGFIKNHYRKYNIKSEELTPGDDFGMMREVLTRRFKRLIKEHGLRELPSPQTDEMDDSKPQDLDLVDQTDFPAWPDVVLIDGGRGQLNAALAILDDLEISHLVTAIGIAKGPNRNAGRETFFKRDGTSFTLPDRDPVLYFTQRLRDEAHRYAIGTHRKKRAKSMIQSPLDDIPGIGARRKRALLNAFGSAAAVKRAGITDLETVEGISAQMARTIYDHFNEQSTG